MKQICAVVRPFRAQAVIEALLRSRVASWTVSEAKGYGRQKSYLSEYLGSEYAMAFLPKVEVTAWVADADVDRVLREVIPAARTGRMGDGKVFVVPLVGDAVEF